MSNETVSAAISNGDSTNPIQATVKETSEPLINGLVVTNPDGSDIAAALETLATAIQASTQNTDATLMMLKKIVNMLAPLIVTDSSHRQKVTIESPPQILGYYSYPAGGFNLPVNAAPAPNTSTHYVQPVQVGPVDQRQMVRDNARIMFALSTRANLSFT